jgi:Mor family transcriptional regulator
MLIGTNQKLDVSWIRDLQIEESDKQYLPWAVGQMIDAIGLDSTIDLLKLFGGLNIHIPMLSSAFQHFRNRSILERFDGTNHRALAREFGISDKYCKDILRASQGSEDVEPGKHTDSRLELKLNQIKPQ